MKYGFERMLSIAMSLFLMVSPAKTTVFANETEAVGEEAIEEVAQDTIEAMESDVKGENDGEAGEVIEESVQELAETEKLIEKDEALNEDDDEPEATIEETKVEESRQEEATDAEETAAIEDGEASEATEDASKPMEQIQEGYDASNPLGQNQSGWNEVVAIVEGHYTNYVDAGGSVVYSFTPSEGGWYVFRSANNGDAYGTLYDSSYSMIKSDDDSGIFEKNFRIVAYLNPGDTYYLEAKWCSSESSGNITLQLAQYAPVEITEGTRTVHIGAGEKAAFSFTPSESGCYVFRANERYFNEAYLYDSGHGYLLDAPGHPNFWLVASLEAGETYYYEVCWESSSYSGDLVVTLEKYAPVEITEGTRTVHIGAGERVEFSFTPSESGWYSFRSNADQPSAGYLYDPMHQYVDGKCGYNNFRVVAILEAGETYYYEAGWDYSFNSGDMDVTLEKYAPVEITEGTYTVHIDAGKRADFSFTPSESGWYSFRNNSSKGRCAVLYESDHGLPHYASGGTSLNTDVILKAGKTYFYESWWYDSSSSGDMEITLQKYSPIEVTEGAYSDHISLGDRNVYSFTPSESGLYVFNINGSLYGVVYLYDSSLNSLQSSSGWENARLVASLAAGETYYYEVHCENCSSPCNLEITLGKYFQVTSEGTYTVHINAGERVEFGFTSSESGLYLFRSNARKDCHAELHDSGQSLLQDAFGHPNFWLYASLEAGKTYYYKAFWSDSGYSGDMEVTFEKCDSSYFGFKEEDGELYWYEDGIRKGVYGDPMNVIDAATGIEAGHEIYDPATDQWYWLQARFDGAAARNKEVWIPYVFQNEKNWSDSEIRIYANNADKGMEDYVYQCMKERTGKWVRYDGEGTMLKGWVTIQGDLAKIYPDQIGNTYYYDHFTGTRANGDIVFNGVEYHFDETTGALIVQSPLRITQQPQSQIVKNGEKAVVSVEATGDGLTYQWYLKNKTASKFSKSSVTRSTYSVTMSDTVDGRQLYCIITDQYGDSLTTETVTLTQDFFGFKEIDGELYWYEGGVRQGVYGDPKNARDAKNGIEAGREIYDPVTNQWYWLQAQYDGAVARNKEVWIPYIYQDEDKWGDAEIRMNANNADEGMKDYVYQCMKERTGKWVRYDGEGTMLKGWVSIQGDLAKIYPDQIGNTYYYDSRTGTRANGDIVFNGVEYHFDETTGALIVRASLQITQQPQSQIVKNGEKAVVSVEATGEGLTYQWYLKNKTASKFSKSSVTKSTYSVTMSDAVNGRQLYCVITDIHGDSVTTDTVTLSQVEKLAIAAQPVDVTVANGEKAAVAVEARGEGLSYQWYLKNKTASKFTKSSVTKSTYSVTMSDAVDGRQVYCIITDKNGNTLATDIVTLHKYVFEIVVQPQDVMVANGEKAVVAVEARGEGLSYQWYLKNKTATKFIKSSVTKNVYSVTMSDAVDGRQVYCVVTDESGDMVVSEIVTLNQVQVLSIVAHPEDCYALDGEKASATVVATGNGLTYQWYLKNKNSTKFSRSSIISNTYSVTMSDTVDGRQVYCIVTDKNGDMVVSETVTLSKYVPISIISLPQSATVANGKKAVASVKATGSGLKYQWYVKNKTASTFTKSSVTKDTYSVTMSDAVDGRQLYCVITDAKGRSLKTNTVVFTKK